MPLPTLSVYTDSQIFSISQDENSSNVAIITPLNPQASGTVSYSIAAGLDASAFTIDQTTGALAFKSAPNFETPTDSGANGIYDVLVNAANGGTITQILLHVTVTNVNEPPAITSNGSDPTATVSLAENAIAVTAVTVIDPDAGAQLTYSITGGADAALFQIDAATGALSFKSAPDFEIPADAGGDNVYDVVVQVSDGSLNDAQAIAVSVKKSHNEIHIMILMKSGLY
jgi:hypothetical protein